MVKSKILFVAKIFCKFKSAKKKKFNRIYVYRTNVPEFSNHEWKNDLCTGRRTKTISFFSHGFLGEKSMKKVLIMHERVQKEFVRIEKPEKDPTDQNLNYIINRLCVIERDYLEISKLEWTRSYLWVNLFLHREINILTSHFWLIRYSSLKIQSYV
jgi:hypothetical protein